MDVAETVDLGLLTPDPAREAPTPLTIPVRLYRVVGAPAVDSPPEDQRNVVTCRSEAAAEAIVRHLEQWRRAGQLSPADCALNFFTAASDEDLTLASGTVADAIAQGYEVRSVVLLAADVPVGKVLATITGADSSGNS